MSDRYDHPNGKPFRGIVLVVGLWLIVALIGGAWCSAHARDAKVAAEFQRRNPCPSTGKPTGACAGWVKDHRVPLCAGGKDAVENLQWESTDQSYVKDVLERRLCALMSRYDALAAQCRATAASAPPASPPAADPALP